MEFPTTTATVAECLHTSIVMRQLRLAVQVNYPLEVTMQYAAAEHLDYELGWRASRRLTTDDLSVLESLKEWRQVGW